MSNIPIFLPSDNNYAPYLAACIASICDNTNSICDFYILDGGISEQNRQKILNLKNQFDNFNIEFLQINAEEKFKDFMIPEGINRSTYMRFLIPALKPNLGKVVYMDSDTITLSDIKDLFDESLDDYALGAVWNEKRRAFNGDTKEPMELSDDYKYFNAGVLLIDIPKWIEDDIVKKLFEIEKQYKNKILHADETLLNKYFDNNYKTLDIKYNYTEWDYSFNDTVDQIYTRHYITKIKPWMLSPKIETDTYHNLSDFWHYAKLSGFYEQIVIYLKNDEEQRNMLRHLKLEKLLHQMNIKKLEKLRNLKKNIGAFS